MKKTVFILVGFVILLTSFTLLVNANESEVNEKIREFLDTKEIVINDKLKENDYIVYKIWDVTNDKYFKVALYDKEIHWYDDVIEMQHKIIESDLEAEMKKMSDEDTVEIIVELVFDDTKLFNKLAESYPKYFNRSNEIQSSLSVEEVKTADIKRREIVKETFSSFNQEMVSDYDIEGVSEYAPFVVINATKDEIIELVESGKALQIGLTYDIVDYASNNQNYSTMINQIHNLSQKGAGVIIGQIETTVPDVNNSQLRGKAISVMGNCTTNPHATEVAGILIGTNGVAPEARLISTCSANDSTFVAAVSWLISAGVNVINMSGGTHNGAYTARDRYVEAVTYYTNVTFVAAVGNDIDPNNPCPGQFVGSPAKAFNVISVGGLNHYANPADPNSIINAPMYLDSCYNTPSTAGTRSNKPDLVAPGTGFNYTDAYSAPVPGTSFSSPLVAGTAALMMAGNSNLKSQPEVVKSALIATARPLTNYPRGYIDYNKSGHASLRYNHNDMTGAGVLNAKGAYDLVRWGQYYHTSLSGGLWYEKQLTSGTTLTVALAWSKPNSLGNIHDINSVNSYNDQAHDFDLEILGPGGQKINKSSSWFNNIEFITFTATYGTGKYVFNVINYDSNGNPATTKIGLSWW